MFAGEEYVDSYHSNINTRSRDAPASHGRGPSDCSILELVIVEFFHVRYLLRAFATSGRTFCVPRLAYLLARPREHSPPFGSVSCISTSAGSRGEETVYWSARYTFERRRTGILFAVPVFRGLFTTPKGRGLCGAPRTCEGPAGRGLCGETICGSACLN